MAGLCGVVEWAMEGACVHLVSTPGVLGFALSLSCKCTCCFRLWEYLRRVTCLVFEKFLFGFFFLADFRVLLAAFRVLRPVGFSYCLGDRRDRPCRDPLKRDSGRYAITLIRRQFVSLPSVGDLPCFN